MSDLRREERQKNVNDALAITRLGEVEPTDETKKFAQLYVDGEITLEEMKEKIMKMFSE